MKKNTLDNRIIKKAQDRIDFTSRCIMRIMHNEELSDTSKSSIVYNYYQQTEDYISGLADGYITMADTFNEDVYDKLRGYERLMINVRWSNK